MSAQRVVSALSDTELEAIGTGWAARFQGKVQEFVETASGRRAECRQIITEGSTLLDDTTATLRDMSAQLREAARFQIKLTRQYAQPLFPKVRTDAPRSRHLFICRRPRRPLMWRSSAS